MLPPVKTGHRHFFVFKLQPEIMEIKDQEATPEQKATIKKLHNDEVKKSKISAYIIGAVICFGTTFISRLKPFDFIGSAGLEPGHRA